MWLCSSLVQRLWTLCRYERYVLRWLRRYGRYVVIFFADSEVMALCGYALRWLRGYGNYENRWFAGPLVDLYPFTVILNKTTKNFYLDPKG